MRYTRPAREHILKTDPEMFRAMLERRKTYELRKDDRGFQEGDYLELRETVFSAEEMAREGRPLEYTHRLLRLRVTHVLKGPCFGLQEGWVILSCK